MAAMGEGGAMCIGGLAWVFVGDYRQQQGRARDMGVAEGIMVVTLGDDHGCTRRIREEKMDAM